MRFIINPKIFVNFPGLIVGVVIAKGIDNKKNVPEISKMFVDQQNKVKSSLTIDLLKEDPRIKAWQEAYKHFKSKPSEYRCSIENLCRMIFRGKELRQSSNLVDLYNYISLKYLLPAGGEDIDQIKGNILLTYAGNNENPITLLGDEKEEKPYAGEIIYKDDNGAICRRWNWREAARTKLTPETKNAFLVIEALPPVQVKEVESAVQELKELIERFCDALVETAILTKNNPSIDIIKNGSKEHKDFFNESL